MILMLTLYGAYAPAQTDSVHTPASWHATVMHDAGTFVQAFLFIGSAPARWNGQDIANACVFVGTTGVVAFGDEGMNAGFRSIQGRTGDRIESVVRLYGEVWVVAALCGSAYAAGVFTGDEWVHETAFLAGSGLILSAVATQLVKYTAGRSRPYTLDGPDRFRMFSTDDDHHSFPSGHTAAAFALSTVLAHQIGNGWATAGLYTLAGLTSLSRVYAGEHWFSDCVFSAMLSTAITHSLLKWYDARNVPEHTGGLQVSPTLSGVALVYTF